MSEITKITFDGTVLDQKTDVCVVRACYICGNETEDLNHAICKSCRDVILWAKKRMQDEVNNVQ